MKNFYFANFVLSFSMCIFWSIQEFQNDCTEKFTKKIIRLAASLFVFSFYILGAFVLRLDY